jgi:hypothetical protein
MKLKDGRQLTFLWLRVDQAMDLIAEAAAGHVGHRFTALA